VAYAGIAKAARIVDEIDEQGLAIVGRSRTGVGQIEPNRRRSD
jgi:hypothetical protein